MDVSKTIVATNEIEDGAVTNDKLAGGIEPAKLQTLPRNKVTQPLSGNGTGTTTITINATNTYTTVCSYAGNVNWDTRKILITLRTGWGVGVCSAYATGTGTITGRLLINSVVQQEWVLHNGSGVFPLFMSPCWTTSPGGGASPVEFQVKMSGGTSVTIENVAISTEQF